jgi:hypothetical protein
MYPDPARRGIGDQFAASVGRSPWQLFPQVKVPGCRFSNRKEQMVLQNV